MPCTKPPWVVFDYVVPNNNPAISAMRADGSSFHPLDLSGVHGFGPSVAPDSKSMVYLMWINDGFPQQVEGLNVFDFTTRTNRTLAQSTIGPDNNIGFSLGALSPNNQLVAYAVDFFEVHVVGLDGSNDRVLNVDACGPGWQARGRPVFSPDSSTLYISAFGCLESIRTDNTADAVLESQLTEIDPNPSFSPDHSQFVAQVACGMGELRVFSMNDLPGDPCSAGTKLVEGDSTMGWNVNHDANAAWGPSNLIAYMNGKDIMLIDPSGGAPHNLTAGITTGSGGVVGNPSWASGCAEIP